MKIPAHTFKKLALASVIAGASFAANADIVTSVKPLGFIASSIADGVLNTDVIVPAGASPHDYSLKPTDVQKVKNADVFLWIGEDVDSFLEKTADSLDKNKVIEISHFDEIKPLLGTSSHHHHHHDHDEADEHHHDHDHAKHEDEHEHEHELETNWHIWYSPAISKVVAQKVADKLTSLYPAQKEKIAQNLAQFNQSLDQQGEQIKAELAGVQGKGFYVFHDAYGYFNDAYGLKQTGAFTINPLVAPGAKTLAKIKEEILEHKVNCLFAEPQFTPKVIESLQKNTNVNVGQLDPLGEKVALGKDSYARFLKATADSYKACLAK
ncbi:MAG: zinc ABC transporter substrate-binding protein ZnuA [Pasteurellaceae bacterium]|nr:zinc ABC transporter substrate-binding protein ZnuA [Pasteurellaceae bacterium]